MSNILTNDFLITLSSFYDGINKSIMHFLLGHI